MIFSDQTIHEFSLQLYLIFRSNQSQKFYFLFKICIFLTLAFATICLFLLSGSPSLPLWSQFVCLKYAYLQALSQCPSSSVSGFIFSYLSADSSLWWSFYTRAMIFYNEYSGGTLVFRSRLTYPAGWRENRKELTDCQDLANFNVRLLV